MTIVETALVQVCCRFLQVLYIRVHVLSVLGVHCFGWQIFKTSKIAIMPSILAWFALDVIGMAAMLDECYNQGRRNDVKARGADFRERALFN
jgi:hypothetical protein